MHLRNRNKVLPPKNFDDDPNDETPRLVNYREIGEMSSDLEEEIYSTPTKRSNKRKIMAYRGPIMRFNPYHQAVAPTSVDEAGQALPFPTRYDPRPLVHQYERENPEEAKARWRELKELAAQRGFDHAHYSIFGDLTTDQPLMPPNLAKPSSATAEPKHQPSITAATRAAYTKSKGSQGPTNARRNTRETGLALVEAYNKKTNEEVFMEEMETSDEDKYCSAPSTPAKTKNHRPRWGDIGAMVQLDIAEEVAIICEYDHNKIMRMLKLTSSEHIELRQLHDRRMDLLKREQRNSDRLTEETQDLLLHGNGNLSQETFRGLLGKTIYSIIGEDIYSSRTTDDLKKGRAYLTYCGLDPSMLDWIDPPMLGPLAISRGRASTIKPNAGTISRGRVPTTKANVGAASTTPTAHHSKMAGFPESPLQKVCPTTLGPPRKHLADGASDSPSRRPGIQLPRYVLNQKSRGHQDHPIQSIENRVSRTPSQRGPALGLGPAEYPMFPAAQPQLTQTRPLPTPFPQEPPPTAVVMGTLRHRPSHHQTQSEATSRHRFGVSNREEHPQIQTLTPFHERNSSLIPRLGGAVNGVSIPQSSIAKKRPVNESGLSPQTSDNAAGKKRAKNGVDPRNLDASGFPVDILVDKTTNGPLNLAGYPQKSTKNMTINGPLYKAAPVQTGARMSTAGGIMPVLEPQYSTQRYPNERSMQATPTPNLKKELATGETAPESRVAALGNGINGRGQGESSRKKA